MKPQTFEKDGHAVTTTVPSERTALLAAGFTPVEEKPAHEKRTINDVDEASGGAAKPTS